MTLKTYDLMEVFRNKATMLRNVFGLRQQKPRDWDVLKHRGYGVIGLWDIRDSHELDWVFLRINRYRSPLDYETRLRLIEGFEVQQMRHWYDQRSSAPIEPIKVTIKKNTALDSGIARWNQIIANRSNAYFFYMASGTGTSTPFAGQTGLDNENARTSLLEDGALEPEGNVLRDVGRFSRGVPDALIAEFGSCDEPIDPSTFGWRIAIEDQNERLDHKQDLTEYTNSHSMVSIPI
jgi:hypothetical protein